ncbi:hypothetical protein F5888DRAFT_1633574 [Russula emetica]|nr:hypothetical protein F5888DRAFT_1633574 [Russula emetica]
MVEIYLDFNEPLLLLSIPSSEIQRLSYRPLKWLRFITSTICGARGNLLWLHNGPIVDYKTTAYKHWGNGLEMKCMIHDKFVKEYQSIPILQKPVDPSRGEPGVCNCGWRPQNSLIDTMDNTYSLMMCINGITPEMRMAEWQKEEEEKQLKNKAVDKEIWKGNSKHTKENITSFKRLVFLKQLRGKK